MKHFGKYSLSCRELDEMNEFLNMKLERGDTASLGYVYRWWYSTSLYLEEKINSFQNVLYYQLKINYEFAGM